MSPKPLLLVRYRLAGGLMDEVLERCDVRFLDGPVLPPTSAEDLARTWGIWTFGERIDDELLDRMPALRCVVNFGVGVDGIDRDALARRGISFAWPIGANAEAVADHAMALMLAVQHRIVENDRLVREGAWETDGYLPLASQDAYGKRLGVIGLGAIGRAFVRRARAFDMEIRYATPRPLSSADEHALGISLMDLDELMGWADVISLHCPLTDETRGLITRARIDAMRPDAVLVNTARGGVVDQDALIAALVERRIAGAGLDVFAAEPHVPPVLRALPNVVLTPHIADATPGAEAALIAHCARVVLDTLDAG
ncbi:MAG: D-glycerate dehydrogenase [Actinobacteria bacterium]|nr:D-glycerate dehydrogenase [Actinomycetota bacterium]